MKTQIITWALVFAAVAGLDFFWTFYTKAINDKAALRAGFWASGIIVFSGLSQIGYVNDPVLLIPAAAGALVGTYAAVRLH